MVNPQHPTDWLSSSKAAKAHDSAKLSWTRRHKTGLGLVFAGVVAGGVVAGTLGASAATGGSGSRPSYGMGGYGMGGPAGGYGLPPAGGEHGARPPRRDGKPLSASLTASLKAKALVAVPGGTVNRVESGFGSAAYVAHVTKADGTHVIVKFDKNQKVTAVETAPAMGDPKNRPPGARGAGPADHPGGGGPEGGSPRGGPPGEGPRFNPEA